MRSARSGLVAPRAAVVERRAQHLEFGLQRSDPDAEDHSPTRDAIEGAVALGDRERVVVAEHEHVRREADARRDRAEVAERGERIPVATAAHGRDVLGDDDVLAARDVLVPEAVGSFDEGHDVGELGVDLPRRVAVGRHREQRGRDSEPHDERSPWWAGFGRKR